MSKNEEVNAWPKGVVFWTTKGGAKSSDFEARGRDRSDFKRKRRKKAEGSVGRPNCLDEEKLTMLFEAYYSRPYSFRELADMFGVSRMTVWRAVQDAPAFPR